MPAKNAEPEVIKATEFEVLKFESLEGKIAKATQQIQILDFQIADEQRKFANTVRQLNSQKDALKRDIDTVRPEYQKFMQGIADKYGMVLERMTIDTDTGILKEEESGPPPTEEPAKKPPKKTKKVAKKATKKAAKKRTKKAK